MRTVFARWTSGSSFPGGTRQSLVSLLSWLTRITTFSRCTWCSWSTFITTGSRGPSGAGLAGWIRLIDAFSLLSLCTCRELRAQGIKIVKYVGPGYGAAIHVVCTIVSGGSLRTGLSWGSYVSLISLRSVGSRGSNVAFRPLFTRSSSVAFVSLLTCMSSCRDVLGYSTTTLITAVTHQGIQAAPGGNILCRVVQLVGMLAGEACTPHWLQQRTARRRSRPTPSALYTLFPKAACSKVKNSGPFIQRVLIQRATHAWVARPASR